MRSIAWIAATVIGFLVFGVPLHSPGATGLGQHAFVWDVPSAIFGAVLGSIVFGLATPAEAAAVGAFGGFVMVLVYRYIGHWREMPGRVGAVAAVTSKEFVVIVRD